MNSEPKEGTVELDLPPDDLALLERLADERAARQAAGKGEPAPEPIPGMAELVAAMVRAGAEGDQEAVRKLAEIGKDPAKLQSIVKGGEKREEIVLSEEQEKRIDQYWDEVSNSERPSTGG